MKKINYLEILVFIGEYCKEKGLSLFETTVAELMDELSKEEGVPF